jgi:methyl-accepting chemotaxis protein
MASKNTDLDKVILGNLSKNLAENADHVTEGKSLMIENLPITVFRVSSKSLRGIEYTNKNIEKLTGYSREDFVSQEICWFDIVFKEDIPKREKTVEKAKKNKTFYQIEYRIKKADGNIAFILEKGYSVYDNSGNLAFIEGVFLDVTAEVKRREDSLKILVSSIPEPLIAWYVDMTGRVKYTNDYFLRLHKFKSVDQAVGMEVHEFLETNTKTITETVIETGNAVYSLEADVKFKVLDKPLFSLVSSVPVIDDSGAMMGVLTIVTDLTEMKQKEKEAQDLLEYANTCMKDLGGSLRKIGEGDLETSHLEKIKDDDFGKTFDDFNKFVDNLKFLIENALKDTAIPVLNENTYN